MIEKYVHSAHINCICGMVQQKLATMKFLSEYGYIKKGPLKCTSLIKYNL